MGCLTGCSREKRQRARLNRSGRQVSHQSTSNYKETLPNNDEAQDLKITGLSSLTSAVVRKSGRRIRSREQLVPHSTNQYQVQRESTQLAISTDKPRLLRSLNRLNVAIAEFSKICAKYGIQVMEDGSLNDAILSVLNQVSSADASFDTAAALEDVIDEALVRRDQKSNERSLAKTIGRFVAKIYPLAKILVEIGGIAAQSGACVPAAVVLKGSIIVMDALMDARNVPQDMLSTLDSISYQATRITGLRDSEKTDSVREKSIDLLTAIMEYYSSCLKACHDGLLVNTAKMLFADQAQEYRQVTVQLHLAIQEFDQALSDQTRALVIEISKASGEQHVRNLFEWLLPSHWEVIGQLCGHLDRRLGGTLRWLHAMSELTHWLTSGNTLRVLWITGFPGVGKSIIAAYIVYLLATIISDGSLVANIPGETKSISSSPRLIRTPMSKTYLAFFFCRDGDAKLMYAHNIVRTFSYQLACQSDVFRQELDYARVADRFTMSPTVGIRLMYARLIGEPLCSVVQKEGCHDIYCIIDAPDEMDLSMTDSRSGKSEIAILLKLLSETPAVRLLVTSRPIREISDAMNTFPSVKREISSTDNRDDITLYVGWKVSGSKKLQHGFDDLGISPVSHFPEAAHGNFLWTELVLRFLEDSSSASEFEAGLRESSDRFHELYRQVLKKISAAASPGKKRIIKEIIRATSISPCEFEVSELQALIEEILNDRIFDFAHLLETECGTFLRLVEGAHSTSYSVQIIHQTFRDFITSEASLDIEFHVSVSAACADIAFVLLRYLSEHDFGSQLIDGKFVKKQDDDLWLVRHRFPLLKYAATQWSFHVHNSSRNFETCKNLWQSVQHFFSNGPLLVWIESLSVLNAVSALENARENMISWADSHPLETLGIEATELYNWARDIGRLCAEYGSLISNYPNGIHSVLFDLFPSSLFRDRYGTGSVSISGGTSFPVNPAIVGATSFYDEGYYLSAFLHDSRRLFALACPSHIRIASQTFGDTIYLLSPPTPIEAPSKKWAVLSMSFAGSRLGHANMFAVIHVPLGTNEDASDVEYCPELSIWDVDSWLPLASAPLRLSENSEKICLITSIQFSKDLALVSGGVWKYDISKQHVIVNYDLIKSAFAKANVVVHSPDGRSFLQLFDDEHRTLICRDKCFTFIKPPSYPDGQIHPTPHKYEGRPFIWWQLWQESMRAYQFSADSRWFARFTEQQYVILYDLENCTERLIYQPGESFCRISVNNLVFDVDSERLAWTFNHERDNSNNTRIEVWSLKSMSSIGGFQLGRYGWRERIDFASNRDHILTYRRSVAMWNILQGLAFEETNRGQRLNKWTLGKFSGYMRCLRLGYCSAGTLCAVFPETSPSSALAIQTFNSETGRSRELSFETAQPWFKCNKRGGFPWTSDGRLLAIWDTILDISDPGVIKLNKTIGLLPGMKTLGTAYHLSASLMACLQCNAEGDLSLRLYCTRENRMLKSFQVSEFLTQLTFPTGTKHFPPVLLIFDPANPPSYLFIMIPQTSDISDSNTSIDSSTGTVHGILFDLPSFNVSSTLCLSNAGWSTETVLYGFLTANPRKVVICEETTRLGWCRLWVVDLWNGNCISQLFPNCRQLTFVDTKEAIIAITAEGLVQYKSLISIEMDIAERRHAKPDTGQDMDIKFGWKRILYLPPSFLPCYESGITVHEKGEMSYVGEFGKPLVQIAFEW